MSPSESELRAALREGEPGGVDATALVAAARAAHRQRRVRIGSTLAAAAVVAGVGVGSAFAFGGDAGSSTPAAQREQYTAARSGTDIAPGPDTASGSPLSSIAPGPLADAAAVRCPASAPHLDRGGPAAGSGPLFPRPVEAIKACGYTATGAPLRVNGTQASAVLSGERAAAVTASMQDASVDNSGYCPTYRTTQRYVLVVIGVDRDGAAMAPVTAIVAQNPCATRLTNGTAVRYRWHPPAVILRTLPLEPTGPVAPPTAGLGTPAPHTTPTPRTAPPVESGGRATIRPTPPPTLNQGSPIQR